MPHSPLRTILAAALLATSLEAVQAHNVWLDPDAQGQYLVQFGGHEGKRESYPADKLKSVTAYNRRGTEVKVETTPSPEGIKVRPLREAAMLAAEFDNGFFSKAGDGPMVNKPMNENPGATSGVHARKFHKTILRWGHVARMELGQAFEVRALSASHPHAGQPLQVQVLKDGKPAPGVRLTIGEQGASVTTGTDGTATVMPVAGRNQLLAILRLPVTGDPRTTSLSYEYLFAFETH